MMQASTLARIKRPGARVDNVLWYSKVGKFAESVREEETGRGVLTMQWRGGKEETRGRIEKREPLYDLFFIIFIFLRLEKGVLRWSGTRVRVPFFVFFAVFVLESMLFLQNPPACGRKEGRERDKGREEALLIGDALILRKAARLYWSSANIGVPFRGMAKGIEMREEKESRGKEWGEEEEKERKERKRREDKGREKKRTYGWRPHRSTRCAGSISLKSATRQRNCDGGHEQGQ